MAEERSAKRKRVPTSDEREEEASEREAMETVHDRSARVATLANPITRKDFVRVMLPHLSARKTDPDFRWRKVSPTLLLFPEADDTGMQYEIEGSVRTLLVRKDGTTFEEALLKCRSKALLLNFCTPSVRAPDPARRESPLVPSLSLCWHPHATFDPAFSRRPLSWRCIRRTASTADSSTTWRLHAPLSCPTAPMRK